MTPQLLNPVQQLGHAQIRNPNCELCPLHEGANHVCLLGKVPPQPPRVMVVGEAPGAMEDEAGEPFIGAAGRMLTDLLTAAGISRNDVYITNSVKCRPPANRKPKPKEVKTCSFTYLYRELGELQPEYVLMLGNVALQAVLGKSGITKHRGQAHVKHFPALAADGTLLPEPVTATVFGTFHPAAILRNPQYREPVEADLGRFARMIRGDREGVPETRIRVARTKPALVALRKHLMQAREISFDLETYCDHPQALEAEKANLQEYRGDDHSHVCSIAFSTKEGESYVVPLWHTQSPWGVVTVDGEPRISKAIDRKLLNFLKPALERPDAKYIGHNGKFDTRWLHSKGVRARITFDTLLAAHALDENRMNGLKPLSQVLLGADAYDVGDELKDAHTMDLNKLCTYNGKDTDYTLRLYHKLRPQLIEQPRTLRAFKFLSMPASNALVDIERRGIAVDMKLLNERYATCQDKLEKLRRYMLQYVPRDKRQGFNPGSPQQVAEWLFDDLGYEPVKTTESGAFSTDKSVLSELRADNDDDALKALLKWRKWKKWEGYLKAWLRFQHDGILYPTYRPSGTVTGRLSATGPNVQQVPRDEFMRSIFCARPGWMLVQSDYSQVELRIAAMLADERRMLRIYYNKGDIHMDRAMRITGKLADDVTKEERARAKPVSFGFLYGMGHIKFVTYARDEYDVEYTEGQAYRVRQQFFDDFPGLLRWHERQRRLVRRYGSVTSMFGRTRHLPDINSSDDKVRGEAERQAINTVVQGPASDLMLLACIYLNDTLPPDEARVVGTIHDSILTEVREDKVDEWAPVIKEVMEDVQRVKKLFGADITVPIVVDLEIGTHWGGY